MSDMSDEDATRISARMSRVSGVSVRMLRGTCCRGIPTKLVQHVVMDLVLYCPPMPLFSASASPNPVALYIISSVRIASIPSSDRCELFVPVSTSSVVYVSVCVLRIRIKPAFHDTDTVVLARM